MKDNQSALAEQFVTHDWIPLRLAPGESRALVLPHGKPPGELIATNGVSSPRRVACITVDGVIAGRFRVPANVGLERDPRSGVRTRVTIDSGASVVANL